MAMSATISVDSSGYINKEVKGSVTISNSGGSNVNVIFCQPQAKMTGAPSYEINKGLAVSQPVPRPGENTVVPASGSLVLPCSFVFFSPSGDSTYDCFATIQTSDGSIFSPVADTCSILPLPFPESEQGTEN